MKFWENFKPEILNQKCCRMWLSVHKKCSRLAILGDLGRYPTFIKALAHCLNYKMHLNSNLESDSLLAHTYREMRAMAGNLTDCWLLKVNKIQTLLGIKEL